ncbi:MAG TPA: cytochrome P450 [Solirubrobacteraceae bacterium]|nr:cytochrome P450 [Solirubrobacteraceae bacterium]
MTLRHELPPGPRAPMPFQSIGWWSRPVAYLERARARHGKRFTVDLFGAPPFVMHSEPEHIREIFTAPPDVLHPGEGARILEPVVGSKSVILLDEGAHLEQRKLMLPAFHGERMEALTGLLEAVTEREVERWPRDAAAPLHPRLQALTLEVILRAVFGLTEGERLDALRGGLGEMLEFGARPISMMPQLQAHLGRLGPWKRFAELKARTDGAIGELIAERRAAGEEDGDDVLSMLLAARHEDGSPMTAQELRDELMTLLVAGHETTASQLAWTFERLGREPRVRERLREEVEAGEGDDYLVATIQEAMRRRPVLPNAAPRLTMRPVEVGGWEYPAGVCLVANSYLVHHDPDVYDEPYAFRPERFLEEPPGTYTWIPFGGGRRRCLGASFAMLEMRVVLRAVVRHGGIAPAAGSPEMPRRRSITISPGGGARTRLGAPAPAREPVSA